MNEYISSQKREINTLEVTLYTFRQKVPKYQYNLLYSL